MVTDSKEEEKKQPAGGSAAPAPASKPAAAEGGDDKETGFSLFGEEGRGRKRRGGEGGDGRRGRGRRRGGDDDGGAKWVENLVHVNRSAKVVKGGRRFSYSALLVLGDGMGNVGIGFGKANEVPNAVDKAKKDAQKNMLPVSLSGDTIPHEVKARFGASKVYLMPAPPGAGIIAGPTVRAVVEAAGIRNILSKCHGSTNRSNIVKATMLALRNLRTRDHVEKLRGVKLS